MRLRAEPLSSPRICLYPARVANAEELASFLVDPALYRFIGGAPPTTDVVREQLRRQADGPPPGRSEVWLNWIVRLAADGRAVGTVQATVRYHENEAIAELAWVTAVREQGRGIAKAAAALVVDWLSAHGITSLRAYIHPEHAASQAVAASLGLQVTEHVIDGEHRWIHRR